MSKNYENVSDDPMIIYGNKKQLSFDSKATTIPSSSSDTSNKTIIISDHDSSNLYRKYIWRRKGNTKK
jgi:hypothetical protein